MSPTSPVPRSNADRSLQYLFSEMSPAESKIFERELSEDAELREVFGEQACLVAQWGMAAAEKDPQSAPAPTDPGLAGASASTMRDARPRRIGSMALLIGLAASLFICTTLALYQRLSDVPEFTPSQLAIAWMETRSESDEEVNAGDGGEEFHALNLSTDLASSASALDQSNEPFAETAFTEDDWPEDTSVEDPPSWLVAAVSGVHIQAEPDTVNEQETSGG